MTHRPARLDLRHLRANLYADGIYGLPGAFAPEWVSRLHQECLELHEAASAYKTGRISRGRNRWYFAVHPEQLSGVVDLLTHPYLTSISEALLGADYQVAEVAFDVSFPGSKFQPWHRDFRKHVGMRDDGSLCALAFNVPTVSVTDEMGPFEMVLGTQNDEVAVDNGMFPDADGQAHYERDPRRKKIEPKRGGMSVRTPLAIHRGTANVSELTRPVMVRVLPSDPAHEPFLAVTARADGRAGGGARAHASDVRCTATRRAGNEVDNRPGRASHHEDVAGTVGTRGFARTSRTGFTSRP